MTLQEAINRVKAAGFEPSGGSWEDEYHVYAFSVEGWANCYGHAKFTVHYRKYSGWLEQTGLGMVKLEAAIMKHTFTHLHDRELDEAIRYASLNADDKATSEWLEQAYQERDRRSGRVAA